MPAMPSREEKVLLRWFEAAASNRVEVLEQLFLTHGIPLDARRPRRQDALLLAVEGRHFEASAWLVSARIANGMGVDPEDGEGHTPLWHAVANASPELARLLLAAGANPKPGRGLPLLHEVCRLYADDAKPALALARSLLLYHPTLAMERAPDGTSVAFAATAADAKGILELVWDRSESRHGPNGEGLMHAASSLEMAKWLEEQGVGWTDCDVSGRTPLHTFASRPPNPAIPLLVEHAISCHPSLCTSQDAKGNTPLHAALDRIYPPQKEVVEVLVSSGARWSTRNNDGLSPIQLAELAGLELPVAWHDAAKAEAISISLNATVPATLALPRPRM